MKYLYPPVAGMLLILLSLLAPILVLIALPFARWDKEPTINNYSGVLAMRGDLPWIFSWLSTPDERLPGDLSIEEVRAAYDAHGRFWSSWVWLGLRNQMMTLACWLGHPTTDYAPEDLGFWSRGKDWRYALKIGPVIIITGYQIYKLLDGSFRAAPTLTLKKS